MASPARLDDVSDVRPQADPRHWFDRAAVAAGVSGDLDDRLTDAKLGVAVTA
jgi:hypothetical protein